MIAQMAVASLQQWLTNCQTWNFSVCASLRQEIVSDLMLNPHAMNGIHLSNFVEGQWDHYVQSMQHSGTYGDHLTLQRAVIIFNVQFIISVSTLGVYATAIVSPHGHYNESLPLLILGHFAEGCGDHFVSFDGPVRPLIKRIQDAEEQRALLYNPDSDQYSNPYSDHHSNQNSKLDSDHYSDSNHHYNDPHDEMVLGS